MEPQYRRLSLRIRPFAHSANVSSRGCSRRLQRVVTDFGADLPFAQVMDKLVEHYGIVIAESTIRRITLWHAQALFELTPQSQQWPTQSGCEVIIAQTDGGMVPIVAPSATQSDKRKGKELYWKESKLCLAHPQGSVSPVFAGTLQGDAQVAGQQLFACATHAGFGINTHVHVVGDGAPWIERQVQDQFGSNGSYLVDFYHVCEYLAAANKAISPNEVAATRWMAEQKERLKAHQAPQVLLALQPHQEAPGTPDADAPVRQCHRYLSKRLDQLNYKDALSKGLPIGSGEIESAHRYVVQKRLKLAGCWWRLHNAEHMLALRLNRANHQWGAYWAKVAAQPTPETDTSV